LTSGFGRADFVGMIPVGMAPVGMALSPDGRWLYVTSENAAHSSLGPLSGDHGTLSVINVPKAEINPAASLVASVDAGCEPVRVIPSADGSIVWVTARASDALLAFSAAKLVSAPAHALITGVRVGEAPVGLALVKNGSRIVVADSNRFNAPSATASLAVVNVQAALAGRPALLGYVRTGLFPREMAAVPGGRVLFVTDFASGQLESVELASLP
jgi:DNA-binding beta-propeller fold protein YncE